MAEELIISEDHSPTLYSKDFNAHYHSVHGAMTETNVVFIDSGLKYLFQSKGDISILEIGFGTGLNAYATLLARNSDVNIRYVTLEKFPVALETIGAFAEQLFQGRKYDDSFQRLHDLSWNHDHHIEPGFIFKKVETDFLDFRTDDFFDLVYFDAFAPNTQPELWDGELFRYLYGRLNDGGVLMTYCAKGSVKRTLRDIGFIIEPLPGPPGKREITRAIKPGNNLL